MQVKPLPCIGVSGGRGGGRCGMRVMRACGRPARPRRSGRSRRARRCGGRRAGRRGRRLSRKREVAVGGERDTPDRRSIHSARSMAVRSSSMYRICSLIRSCPTGAGLDVEQHPHGGVPAQPPDVDLAAGQSGAVHTGLLPGPDAQRDTVLGRSRRSWTGCGAARP